MQPQPSLTTSMVSSLPHSIWDVPWIPPPPHGDGRSYQMEGFTLAVFRAASRGTNPNPALNLQAASLDDLVDHLAAAIDDAGRRGDYSQVLASEHTFTL